MNGCNSTRRKSAEEVFGRGRGCKAELFEGQGREAANLIYFNGHLCIPR